MSRKNETYRPCVVLARADQDEAGDAGLRLRRMGWDVYHVRAGAEARRIARMLDAEVVVLDAQLDDESGWLTCAKLSGERPGKRIVLIGDDSPRNQERAQFVGASVLMECEEELASLLHQGNGEPRAA